MPNHVILRAPLSPIPVMGEAFEEVLVDCVGPLPKTKADNQYLCTIMCRATRFPEAVPLRNKGSCCFENVDLVLFPFLDFPKLFEQIEAQIFYCKFSIKL